MNLILASSSPRRRDLLAEAGFTCRVVAPQADEIQEPGESALVFAQRAARDKADWVLAQVEDADCVVVAADTVVIVDDACLGKPRDEADAVDMLRRLRNRTHQVATGVCLAFRVAGSTRREEFVEVTDVEFGEVTDAEIDAYVATGDPMDKAGAYAIQGGAASMVKAFTGSYSNVVGLPVERVAELLG